MLNSTIASYKIRGEYGNSSYRGNCSGLLVKDLLEFFQPRKAADYMCGSGTFGDVCRELKIEHIQRDLNPKFGGFDALNDEIEESTDFIFFHPPYWDIIQYSGIQYGQPDDRDLSRCSSYENFISKLDQIQEKFMYSLRRGGRLAVLVGDIKKNGILYSMQKSLTWLGSPEYCIIKEQHNTFSSRIQYKGKFIPITHEYLLVFKRDDCYILPHRILVTKNIDIRQNEKATWRDLVFASLQKLGGKASLEGLYREMQNFKKCKENPFWKEKIRQVVQIYKDFKRVDRGVYALSY